MKAPTLSPADDLRIDNLVTSHALLVAKIEEEKADRRRILASLERIERALAVPLFYSRTQACRRLGISLSTSYKDPTKLPKPAAESPSRYRVSDVEALAVENPAQPRRHSERRTRSA